MPLPRTAVIPGSVTRTGDSEGNGITSWLRPRPRRRGDGGVGPDCCREVSLSYTPVLMAAEIPLRFRAWAPLPLRRAIRLLYLLPRRRRRQRRRRRRRRRHRQVAVEGPPPSSPPLVDEEREPFSPSSHLLRDISLVRSAQARDFKSGWWTRSSGRRWTRSGSRSRPPVICSGISVSCAARRQCISFDWGGSHLRGRHHCLRPPFLH